VTTYIVFRQVKVADGQPQTLQLVNGGIEGHGDLDAVRRARRLLAADDRAGTFFAVPSTNFHRHNCEMQTVQKELWS